MAQILIVDDEPNVRLGLVQALQAQHHKVFDAPDGDKALRALAREPIDLVIIDIIMPHREGLETIQEIRMNWPDVKIIAISGGGRMRNTEFLTVAEKLGADAVLKKPFSMAELGSAVGDVLDRELWRAG